MYYNFILLFFCLFLSLGFYQITLKYSVSEDSRIGLLYLIFPIIKSYPRLSYILTNLFLNSFICFSDRNILDMLITMFVISLVQALSIIDLKCFRIPNEITLPSIIVIAIVNSFSIGIKSTLLGGLVGFFIIFVLALIRYGQLSGGDIKLGAIIGLLVGKDLILLSLLIGFIFGGLICWFLLINRFIERKDFVPYGPFLSVGAWVICSFGKELVKLLNF